MKLVLLPGLDGTGKLFSPLIKELPSSIEVQVITYDLHKEQTYNELIKYVTSNLPQEEYILLAESFSGPIAYKIALTQPKQLKSLILVATFIENPRPFLLKLIPANKLFAFPIPTIIARIFLLGFSANSETLALFKKTLDTVSPNLIAYRLKEIAQLEPNPNPNKINLKTTYIQASNDRLVLNKSLKSLQKVCDDINIVTITGGHLILQANPIECAKIVSHEVML